MKLLTFDVGGTEIKYAVIEDALSISNKGHIPTPMDSFESFSDVIYGIYQQFKDDVEGIAMSLPGFIDVKNGRCNGGGALVYNHGTDVGRLLSEKCGCKVVLENDGKAAVQAEYEYGSLKGCTNAAVVVIGTAVGGGLVINKEIVRGPHFAAGEFSFINTEASNYQLTENILGVKCSAKYLLELYQIRSGNEERIDGREFFKRYPNDRIAQEVLDEVCTNIAVQIYNLYALLDLEKVAIGGGISRQPIVTEKIQEKFEEVKRKSAAGLFGFDMQVEIVPCLFSNDANLIGSYITYSKW